jgi:hypothetical protein
MRPSRSSDDGDCFSSGIGGETMTVERQFEKLALIVETSREIWGAA